MLSSLYDNSFSNPVSIFVSVKLARKKYSSHLRLSLKISIFEISKTMYNSTFMKSKESHVCSQVYNLHKFSRGELTGPLGDILGRNREIKVFLQFLQFFLLKNGIH